MGYDSNIEEPLDIESFNVASHPSLSGIDGQIMGIESTADYCSTSFRMRVFQGKQPSRPQRINKTRALFYGSQFYPPCLANNGKAGSRSRGGSERVGPWNSFSRAEGGGEGLGEKS